jgi:phage terminase Nu1 subunit (DNA packaging protein)
MSDDIIKQTEAIRKKFMENFFNRQQAAALLDVSIKTMDAWRERGHGPLYYKTRNGRVYYKIDELREWILQQPKLVDKFAAEDVKNHKDRTPA